MYMTKGMRLAGMSNTDRHTVLNLNITPARSFFRLNFSARKSCPQNRYIVVRSSPTRIVLTCEVARPLKFSNCIDLRGSSPTQIVLTCEVARPLEFSNCIDLRGSSPTRIVLTCRIHYPYPIVIGRSILTSMVQPMVYWENATANCNRRTCEIYSQQP
jgi:hypothetical protein